jgi:hypothetical protein
VHSKATNTFTLFLTSILVILTYIETPINRVCNAVINEGLKLIPCHVIVAAFNLKLRRFVRKLSASVKDLILVRLEGALVNLEACFQALKEHRSFLQVLSFIRLRVSEPLALRTLCVGVNAGLRC